MTGAGRQPVRRQATRRRPVSRAALAVDSLEAAPFLLNKLLAVGDRVGRIVEVEAYRGADDPASHAFRGPSPRNAVMFGPAGFLYVYFTYGMHWCANVVCGADGTAMAVLLRAVAPVAGVDAMWAARPAARRESDLGSGPAKLCQALGITGACNGADLLARPAGPVRLLTDGTPPPDRPAQGVRVGVTAAADRPWRWWVPGDPHVSRARPVASTTGGAADPVGGTGVAADTAVGVAAGAAVARKATVARSRTDRSRIDRSPVDRTGRRPGDERVRGRWGDERGPDG
ncbi:MAG TPA: DNA-3-methyladenine glycosylase [Acidimicrobiales bacterium]|nr:DNA-3-methyladenine glycosylase [Acidimicrobiales bacterium]